MIPQKYYRRLTEEEFLGCGAIRTRQRFASFVFFFELVIKMRYLRPILKVVGTYDRITNEILKYSVWSKKGYKTKLR